MYTLSGQPLSLDVSFTHNNIQYPSNWLRLSSAEEREAIGISEEPDPTPVDQRFYSDAGIPKDHAQLVEQWIGQIKQTANSLLAHTDWFIIRASETGIAAPQSVLNRRAEIRTISNTKEASLRATTTTDELAAYVTDLNFYLWSAPTQILNEVTQ